MPISQTPMMQQYLRIKKDYQDCLLLYRMGDFYELFMDDAHIGAQVLNITLTGKANGKNGRVPMAGVPYHAVDGYIAKLVKAGYKVAICEQMSPPNKKGLVEREVVRVITPGTMLDEKALEKKGNNYIISLDCIGDTIALSIADLSTGYFATSQITYIDKAQYISDELSRLHPSECILPSHLYNDPSMLKILSHQKNMHIYDFKDWDDYAKNSHTFLKKHFGVSSLHAFGIEHKKHAITTAATLLGYLEQTQKTTVKHIKKIINYEHTDTMMLDRSTMINLEMFSTIREHDTQGSLLSILDETQTAMGGRLLKTWVKNPLIQKNAVLLRHDAVEELFKQKTKCDHIRNTVSEIHDIERLLSRLSVNIGNPRDVINLKNSLNQILDVKSILQKYSSKLFQQINKSISPKIDNLIAYIEKHIVNEPPIEVREGGIIQKGIHKELDTLRNIITNSKDFIADLEKKEREKTGINSLKIRFNQVFGFYIEVSKANAHLAPKEYMRKQTLVNGERFITKDLKHHEEIILTAEEKAHDIEYQLFQDILSHILTYTEIIQDSAQAIAILDCISNFAYISQKYHYVRPTLLYSGEIRIQEGRHPVVERLLEIDNQFVPNDVCLDNVKQSLLLITGPNMAGKSVFIRQIALIALLNQIGCFVPAKSAKLSLVDRIFVRSGASDVITSGMSTFMVEMVETAHILLHATSKSLIIMDEIGRGTSTYDGISIAWAVAEYLVTHFKSSPKILFATHYHELQKLEEKYPKAIRNFHMSVADDKGEPIFLHTLVPGGASHSFGIAVAKLAGIPEEVIENAKNMLTDLEKRNQSETRQETVIRKNQKETISQQTLATHLFIKQLSKLDIANLTPLEALNTLAELKEEMALVETQSTQSFLEKD